MDLVCANAWVGVSKKWPSVYIGFIFGTGKFWLAQPPSDLGAFLLRMSSANEIHLDKKLVKQII